MTEILFKVMLKHQKTKLNITVFFGFLFFVFVFLSNEVFFTPAKYHSHVELTEFWLLDDQSVLVVMYTSQSTPLTFFWIK